MFSILKFVCVCTSTCMCVCVHVWFWGGVFTCMCTCVCGYAHVYIYGVCTCEHTCRGQKRVVCILLHHHLFIWGKLSSCNVGLRSARILPWQGTGVTGVWGTPSLQACWCLSGNSPQNWEMPALNHRAISLTLLIKVLWACTQCA